MPKVDHWDLIASDADKYIILFSLEYQVETMRPTLGGFLRIPALEILHANDGDLLVVDKLADRAITRMLKEADNFLRHTAIRTRMDNKCRGPFIVHTEVKLDRYEFAAYIDNLKPSELIEKFINNKQARAVNLNERAVKRSTLLKRGVSY